MDFHKNKISTEFKVGIFTLIGILILVFSYAWFTEYITSNKYTEIKVKFSNAGNIEKGNDVTMLGVKRGRVNELKVEKDQVVITLRVMLDDPLYEETSFIINEVDLMGDVQVDITPGKGNTLLDLDAVHQGFVKPGMGSLISEMTTVVIDLKQLLTNLSQEDGVLSNTRAVIDTSLELVTDLKESFTRNSRSIDLVITRSAEITKQLTEIIAANKDNLDQSFESIIEMSAELNSTLQEFKKTSESIRNLADKASQEGSTVNRLISEDDLYISLERSITRLDSLLQDIEENPKKYFKFSLF
jgi:phospholipid/cholesterol/gamma-HCH transport system substrate-binding protein